MPGAITTAQPALAGGSNSSGAKLPFPRIRRGQKLEDIQHPPSSSSSSSSSSGGGAALSLSSIDSPFQLQEYLSHLIRQDPHDVERIVALPQPGPTLGGGGGGGGAATTASSSSGNGGGESEGSSTFAPGEEEHQSVDTDVWVYEQLRRIVLDFSSPWLVSLQRECDRTTRPSCAAMNAEDWMYLCASHGEEKQCCAIDYIIHTLDGTTGLLNSARHFPARTYIPTTSLRHFGSTSRRLSRIFVHAYEHHRDVFEACEAETSLYARFLALVQAYDLIDTESLPKVGAAAAAASSSSSPSASRGNKSNGSSSSSTSSSASGSASTAGAAGPTSPTAERNLASTSPPKVKILSRPGVVGSVGKGKAAAAAVSNVGGEGNVVAPTSPGSGPVVVSSPRAGGGGGGGAEGRVTRSDSAASTRTAFRVKMEDGAEKLRADAQAAMAAAAAAAAEKEKEKEKKGNPDPSDAASGRDNKVETLEEIKLEEDDVGGGGGGGEVVGSEGEGENKEPSYAAVAAAIGEGEGEAASKVGASSEDKDREEEEAKEAEGDVTLGA